MRLAAAPDVFPTEGLPGLPSALVMIPILFPAAKPTDKVFGMDSVRTKAPAKRGP